MENNKQKYIWALLRLSLGWMMFWAFIDKVWGLGFATEPAKSWLNGASPTFGFLKFGTHGPLAGMYQSMAGNPVVDWLFMMGLLFIGVALILGAGVRIAGYSGALMMILMYTAKSLPPENNPFLDEHIIYAFVFIGLTFVNAGDVWGIGKWWSETELVKKNTWLK